MIGYLMMTVGISGAALSGYLLWKLRRSES